jgi:hypothetical protein
MSRASADQSRAALQARLQARRAEIEQAARIRISAIADPSEVADPNYLQGLRAAVSAALDYGLGAIEHRGERSPSVPVALLAQARVAARSGVSFDTVLRRYAAGYALLRDVLIEEAERSQLEGKALKRLLRNQAALFDAVLAAVSEEYGREAQSRPDSTEERRAERVERLLAGELLDTSGLEYDFSGYHLGAIAAGPEAGEVLRDLAKALDRRLLAVSRGEETLWAWLGARRTLDAGEFERLVSKSWPDQVSLAIGEPAQGLAGWRLTHRQAEAARGVALNRPQRLTRYADVALLASVLRDDDLVAFLVNTFLMPLRGKREGGETLHQTLRAYFASGRNVSCAAAALGVTRHTVTNRLRTVEQRIARSIDTCAAEIETALRLADSQLEPR